MRRGHLTVMKQTDTLVLEFLAPGSTHHTGFIEFGFKRNSRASMRTSRDFDVNSFRLFKRGYSSNVGFILRLLIQLPQFLLALFELMFQGCHEFIVFLVRRCMALEQMPLQNLFDSPVFWWFCLYKVRYKQSFNSNTSSQVKSSNYSPLSTECGKSGKTLDDMVRDGDSLKERRRDQRCYIVIEPAVQVCYL